MAPAPSWAPSQQLAGTPMTAGQRRPLALPLDAALTPKAHGPSEPPTPASSSFSVDISGSGNYPVLLGPPLHGIFCLFSLTD